MRWLKALLLCLTGVMATSCLAAPGPMEITLSNQEYPPYMSETIPWYGLLSRVVVEAFQRENVKVHYVFYPNNRTLESARNGTVDGSPGWAITPERSKDLVFTDPVMNLRMVFFQRAGAEISWQTLGDLAPYRIGVTSGNTYSTEFSQLQAAGKLHVEPSPDDVANFRKLLAKRIDLFPIDSEVGNMLLIQHFHPEQRSQIYGQSRAYWIAEMRVAIWRKHPQAAELVRRFNLGLKLLHSSGDYDRIVDQTRKEIYQHAGLD